MSSRRSLKTGVTETKPYAAYAQSLKTLCLGALLTGESVAATLPVVVGVNFTVNALDWPAATVSGKFNPVRAKPAPVIVACDTLRLALPGLLRITV